MESLRLGLEGETIFLPTFDISRAQREYELNLYIELTLHRTREFAIAPPQRPVENFRLNPDLEETYAILEQLTHAPEVAVDVETGYGQINTVGFAWSPQDAIAINVLPERCGDHSFYELWTRIRGVLEAPSRKIFQNFIYDTSYFSAYGINTRGEIFDTMWAMKFLWPELKSNLGNVGRFYTNRVYWKDDGKVTDEEGRRKIGATYVIGSNTIDIIAVIPLALLKPRKIKGKTSAKEDSKKPGQNLSALWSNLLEKCAQQECQSITLYRINSKPKRRKRSKRLRKRSMK